MPENDRAGVWLKRLMQKEKIRLWYVTCGASML
jgi:hypothetical protein